MTALFDASTFAAFCLAAAALVAAPGPGQALVLARTFQGGARDGLLTAAGLEIGTLLHTAAASAGLSAVLATSAAAFNLVKLIGAAYLILLGVAAWSRAGQTLARPVTAIGNPRSGAPLLLHAAVTGTLNPKVALFFLAFLPQFVNPSRGHVLAQFLVLGLTFAALGLAGDSAVALLGHRARARLLGSPAWAAWRERVTGAILVGLGVRLAFLSRR
jgi:threonine/homoserine/homoserine lactone efflux protein